MGQVKWTKALSVGVQAIDEQHKTLIEHLNNLTLSVENYRGSAIVVSTLGFLMDYTDTHFSAEEKLMITNNYPGFDDHRIKHNEFKSTLKNLEEDFREDGATQDLADSIDTLLVNWLLKHIQSVDVELGLFIKRNGIEIVEEG